MQDLRARPLVDEDDEAKPELLLVGLVEAPERRDQDRVLVAPLLADRARRAVARTDRRVRVERLDLLRLGKLLEHASGLAEWVLEPAQHLDEPGSPLEELGELLGAQLPR